MHIGKQMTSETGWNTTFRDWNVLNDSHISAINQIAFNASKTTFKSPFDNIFFKDENTIICHSIMRNLFIVEFKIVLG